MLRRYLLILIGIGMLGFTGSYTAPTYDDINFSLCSGYTAPTYDDINFSLALSDTCDSCTYSSGNWEIDCSDNCSIDSNIDLSGNNISIVGTGIFLTSANISNYGLLHIAGTDTSNICRVTCINGGCFK